MDGDGITTVRFPVMVYAVLKLAEVVDEAAGSISPALGIGPPAS